MRWIIYCGILVILERNHRVVLNSRNSTCSIIHPGSRDTRVNRHFTDCLDVAINDDV